MLSSGSDLTAAKRRSSQDIGPSRGGYGMASTAKHHDGYVRTRVISQGTGEATATKNYILGDCLGKGAFGSVFRALNWATGETVAVKRVSLANIPRSELGEIMSEIELLKNLRHPNIVKYKGYEKTREFLFIILEYCENGSLNSICKRFGKFPEGLVSVYISQVLEGLQYLHAQGVIHRDIKGANILTNKDGSVKLADFGVATKAGTISGNVVAGSPYWMAPEVIDQSGATAASDIWSVGCVVIELLEGQPPYHSLDPMPALFRIVQDDCPPLPQGASPMVLDFLSHCFQKDPNLRVSAATLLEHPWMCSARRQLRQMKSTGSIGKAVHDQAVRTVRDYNKDSQRRARPAPLRLHQSRPATAGPLSTRSDSPRSLRRVAGSVATCSSRPSSPLRPSSSDNLAATSQGVRPQTKRFGSVDVPRMIENNRPKTSSGIMSCSSSAATVKARPTSGHLDPTASQSIIDRWRMGIEDDVGGERDQDTIKPTRAHHLRTASPTRMPDMDTLRTSELDSPPPPQQGYPYVKRGEIGKVTEMVKGLSQTDTMGRKILRVSDLKRDEDHDRTVRRGREEFNTASRRVKLRGDALRDSSSTSTPANLDPSRGGGTAAHAAPRTYTYNKGHVTLLNRSLSTSSTSSSSSDVQAKGSNSTVPVPVSIPRDEPPHPPPPPTTTTCTCSCPSTHSRFAPSSSSSQRHDGTSLCRGTSSPTTTTTTTTTTSKEVLMKVLKGWK